jgi:diguanylate cyclase (GGDEF)-like protein
MMEDTLVQNVEYYHNKTVSLFVDLKHNTHDRFIQTLDETNSVINQLLVIGSTFSISIVLFIIIATLSISLLTRRNLTQVLEGMKLFALGGTDFSRRLEYNSHDEMGQLIYWFNKLADKLEQDYKSLEAVSITDKLTQLNNRSRTDIYLPSVLGEAQSQRKQIAVIMIDIDHFKSVNDTYGHLVGDAVLSSLAKILKKHATEHDYLSRWGGEEFMLILTNSSYDSALSYAEALRIKIFNYKFEDVGNLTASFGIALSRYDDAQTSIVKRADECLYQAKEQGRNQVIIAAE